MPAKRDNRSRDWLMTVLAVLYSFVIGMGVAQHMRRPEDKGMELIKMYNDLVLKYQATRGQLEATQRELQELEAVCFGVTN